MKKINPGAILLVCALAFSCASPSSASKSSPEQVQTEQVQEQIKTPQHRDVAVFIQTGHSNDVNSIGYSPDGRRIVSGSKDNTIKIWDAETGRELRTLTGHSDEVYSVGYSPDGRRIVSGSEDNTVKIWDAETGQELQTLRGKRSAVQSVGFSPDGRRIVSGSKDNTIRIWDVETGETLQLLEVSNPWERLKLVSSNPELGLRFGMGVSSVAYSPDGRRIVSGYTGGGGIIKIWGAETGRELRTLTGHSGAVQSVGYSPDGRRIVSGSSDKTVKVWDAETGQELRTLTGHTEFVNSVAYSPDGRRIVSGSGVSLQGTTKVWDADTGQELRTIEDSLRVRVGFKVGFLFVGYSPDGRRIVSGSNDNTIKIWDAETGRELRALTGNNRRVQFAAYNLDGRSIVSDTKVWDTETGQILRTLPMSVKAYSPDGRRILSTWGDDIKIWNAETGQELRTLTGHTYPLGSLAYSPDGRRIVSGSYDNTIKIWDAETGRELRTLTGHTRFVYSVAYSPDGKRIISGSSEFVQDAVTIGAYKTGGFLGTIKVWDAETGRELRTMRHTDISSVYSVAYSLDGRRIISGASDNTIKVWDAETGRELQTLKGHTGDVQFVSYSPDGRRIISGASDNTIKVWDAETGRELQTLKGHSGAVRFISYSPDGKRIVSGSDDGTTRIWDAETSIEIVQFAFFTGADNQIASATRGIQVETETTAVSVEGEWITVIPDGYYRASPRGDRYLNVRIGNTVSGIDSYRSIFDNPDVVQARLGGKPDPASKAEVTIQQAASFLPPVVTLQTPATSTTQTASLSVAITDQNQPIKNIKILVNGRLLGKAELSGIKGLTGVQPERASLTVTGNQKTLSFTLPLSLDPGLNRVEVVAFNGYAETRRWADLTWNAPAGQKAALPNLWILAVGVNRYTDTRIKSLNYCVADAKGMVESLKAQEGTRYNKVNSLLIADGEALAPTADTISGNLKFLENAGPRDVVILFLAGHGISEGGKFYFLPQDATFTGDGKPSRTIPDSKIIEVLDAPGNRLIFIDACQSGGVDNNRLVRSLMGTNAFVFTASKGDELSQERAELGHGVFTYSVMSALKGASGARAEGGVSVISLSGFVQIDVPQRTNNQQHPSAYSLGFYDFPLTVIK